MDSLTTYLIYGVPLVLLLVWWVLRRRRFERRSEDVQKRTGKAEPASLHPVINTVAMVHILPHPIQAILK